jgi:uncharacterized cupin superfamily protein
MFTVLEGEVELTFRGQHLLAKAGETVNVPANAPHSFRNASPEAVRLLCFCAPSGQEKFFAEVGQPVRSRTDPPPALDEHAQGEFITKSKALAPEYQTELLLP